MGKIELREGEREKELKEREREKQVKVIEREQSNKDQKAYLGERDRARERERESEISWQLTIAQDFKPKIDIILF